MKMSKAAKAFVSLAAMGIITAPAAGKTKASADIIEKSVSIITAYASGAADPSHEHEWSDGLVTTPATCTTDGVLTYACTVEGCTERKTEAIPATGHIWDGGVVTMSATCTTDGVRTYTCTECGATKTEAVPATGHKWSGEASAETTLGCGIVQRTYNCTVDGCGAQDIRYSATADTNHAYASGRCTHCGAADPTGKTVTVSPMGSVPNVAIENSEALIGSVHILAGKTLGSLTVNVSEATDAAALTAADEKLSEQGLTSLARLDITAVAALDGGVTIDLRNFDEIVNIKVNMTGKLPAVPSGSRIQTGAVRVHDGEATVLPDLDSDPDFVTIGTDKLSVYVIWYKIITPATPAPPVYTPPAYDTSDLPHKTYKITATATEGGKTRGSGEYERGSTAILKAFASKGYKFAGWFENGELADGGEKYAFTVNGERTLEARFIDKNYVEPSAGDDPNNTGSDPNNTGDDPNDAADDPNDAADDPNDAAGDPNDTGDDPNDVANDPNDTGSDPNDTGDIGGENNPNTGVAEHFPAMGLLAIPVLALTAKRRKNK